MNRLLSRLKISFPFKKYSTNKTCFYEQDYVVDTFCSLFITSPFNLKIRPLDVLKYPNCDKIIIKLYSDLFKPKAKVICIQDKEKFNIFGETTDTAMYDCLVEAPIKSNIYVIAHSEGSINLGRFSGEQICLTSEAGNILSKGCQNYKIDIRSKQGNIMSLGSLHASDIYLEARNTATIDLNHLQAQRATVLTENGDIKIKSSYCEDTIIKTKKGNLYLDNIHNKCTVDILENGLLNMSGFDGTLNAHLKAGNIDIQASKLYDQSIIETEQKGSILLRLSEWIQNNTKIITDCKQLNLSDQVKLSMKSEDPNNVLVPKGSKYSSQLKMNTTMSKIMIEGASWSDMLRLKGIKLK